MMKKILLICVLTMVLNAKSRYPEDADQGSPEEEDFDRRNVVREARLAQIIITIIIMITIIIKTIMTVTIMIIKTITIIMI